MSQDKNDKKEIKMKYAELKKKILGVGYICKGSIVPSYRKCGKAYCRCAKARDKKEMHGPYLLWTRKIKSKTVTKKLSENQALLCNEFIQNSRKLDEILEQMKKLSVDALDLEK